ncbi:MAG: NAD(P)-binding protein [Methylotetracoccus sp.]
MSKIAIIGSGMAGFGAAYRLHETKVPAVMYEKKNHYGGHTASHRFDSGFTLDEGPHISFTKNQHVKDLLANNVRGEYFESKAYVNNYWQGRWIRHPAQCNLFGLPTDLVVSIIEDFIKVRGESAESIRNYQDWLYTCFGKTFADTFPANYTVKYHTTTADNMSTDWVAPRIYRPELSEVLQGALSPSPPNVHYITEFRYPKHGGFAAYLAEFSRQMELRLEHELSELDPREKTLRFANGKIESYDHLISSMPLTELIPRIKGVPANVLAAAGKLACTEGLIITLGIDRADLTDAHWTYFYDLDFTITRLSTPHMQSPNNVPPGCGAFQIEVYFSKKYRPLERPAQEYVERVKGDLLRCGLLRDTDQVIFENVLHIPYAQVIFDLERADALKIVHAYLDELGIAYCGRYGLWEYIWTDESFVSGEKAAQQIIDRL